MSKVIYREITKEDYQSIKNLIGEAFGFNTFVKDKKFLDDLLNLYLQGCIMASSFSKVAEKDHKVIGIILGDAKNDKQRLKRFHNTLSILCSILKMTLSNKENKNILKMMFKLKKVYKEIIQGKEKDFQGCVQLFIVSKESQGLGVGKNLVNYLFNYMKSMNVNSIYLYTDSKCNYGFYEHQNFKRLNEKEFICHVDSLIFKLNVFLYGYTL